MMLWRARKRKGGSGAEGSGGQMTMNMGMNMDGIGGMVNPLKKSAWNKDALQKKLAKQQ